MNTTDIADVIKDITRDELHCVFGSGILDVGLLYKSINDVVSKSSYGSAGNGAATGAEFGLTISYGAAGGGAVAGYEFRPVPTGPSPRP